MKSTREIDIYITKKSNVRLIDVVQFDTGIHLVFTVKDFDIPSGATAKLYVQKPSGKFVFQEDGITIVGNTILIDLENQAITEHGKVPYQVSIVNGSDMITAFTGLMMVEKSLKDSGATESKTVIRAFDEVVSDHVAEFQAKAEQIVQACIATIPEDYTVMEAKVNELANAVKGNLSGAVVVADDVSPVEHSPAVKVHGKNLFDTSKIAVQPSTGNIYISAVGDGYIEITDDESYDGNGHVSPAVKLKELCPQMQAGRRYIISATSDGWNKCMYLAQLDLFWQFGTALTISEEMLECSTGFYGFAPYRGQEHGTCRISNIQIEEGNVATEYAPYIDPSTVKVRRCGKNISSVNSIVSTGNATGTISEVVRGNGTYTASANVTKYSDDAATNTRMTMLFYYTDGTSEIVHGEIDTTNNERDGVARYKKVTGTSNASKQLARIDVNTLGYSSQNSRNAKAENIQLEFGSVATQFEPYNGAEYTPAADGTVPGMTSLSPIMTILTDTEGVTVECEYNVDTKKYIDRKISELLKGSGEA